MATTRIFQHPKSKNTVITTSMGKFETQPDIIGRQGVISTDDEKLIGILAGAGFKELQPVDENAIKEMKKADIPEGAYYFQSGDHIGKSVTTSAGKIPFDNFGIAKVDARVATLLLQAGFTPTDETKLKLVKAGVIKIEIKEVLDVTSLKPKPEPTTDTGSQQEPKETGKPDSIPATGLTSGTGQQAGEGQQTGQQEQEPDKTIDETLKEEERIKAVIEKLDPEQRQRFDEVLREAGTLARDKAKADNKSDEEAEKAGDAAAREAALKFVESLSTPPDPYESLNVDQLVELCKNRKVELPAKRTKASLIRALRTTKPPEPPPTLP